MKGTGGGAEKLCWRWWVDDEQRCADKGALSVIFGLFAFFNGCTAAGSAMCATDCKQNSESATLHG